MILIQSVIIDVSVPGNFFEILHETDLNPFLMR